ncbi:hypothetical protein [Halalkalicoccus subterraneus]|uniref:hypothetical protein n=1 Tax=Halalkalicoccus subterraneus TaxID=2675002 RepID=UPI001FE75822|nr:hypothetical protein [Halalkalicoccus subterraneus]
MSVYGLIVNLNRLSHELSGAVAERERPRIETRLSGIERCPHCENAAVCEAIVGPPPVDATEYESEGCRRSVLRDYRVAVRFTPCGHEVDLEGIEGLDVTIRDGPVDLDYSTSTV